ncbi:MAG TPA: glycosyltransferase family A protein [Chthoniobacterales bacterium]|jgi:glycosyltransferase involved in cell wall biosynthesis
MDTEKKTPALSVILLAPDRYETIRRTVGHLRNQTVSDRIELVIVAPSAQQLGLNRDECEGLCGVSIAECDPANSVAAARACGIRMATAPVIAVGEDHSYPRPNWGEALLRAHQQPWGAVGPVLWNANPGLISWSNFLIAYGPWIGPAVSGVVGNLSEHNSSYKRALLQELDGDLDKLLERQGELHRALQARGHQLYLEVEAETDHFNFSTLGVSMVLRFHAGRAFGAERARVNRWSLGRRLIYTAGVGFIPWMRLRYVLKEIKRMQHRFGLILRILPVLILLLSAAAIGEVTGYLFGAGQSKQALDRFEFSGANLAKRGRR